MHEFSALILSNGLLCSSGFIPSRGFLDSSILLAFSGHAARQLGDLGSKVLCPFDRLSLGF
jgi:hypothetical protein